VCGVVIEMSDHYLLLLRPAFVECVTRWLRTVLADVADVADVDGAHGHPSLASLAKGVSANEVDQSRSEMRNVIANITRMRHHFLVFPCSPAVPELGCLWLCTAGDETVWSIGPLAACPSPHRQGIQFTAATAQRGTQRE
jgi:hypothetical protein